MKIKYKALVILALLSISNAAYSRYYYVNYNKANHAQFKYKNFTYEDTSYGGYEEILTNNHNLFSGIRSAQDNLKKI